MTRLDLRKRDGKSYGCPKCGKPTTGCEGGGIKWTICESCVLRWFRSAK